MEERVGQARAVAHIDRNRTIQAERSDERPRAFHVGYVCVEAVNHIGAARAQRRRQPPAAAADVDHQPSFDTRGFQNIGGRRGGQA